MIAIAAGNYIVLSQRVRNMEKWQAEEKALATLMITEGNGVRIVREPVIPTWLCMHPDHASRVVEIRFSQEKYDWSEPGYGADGRGYWVGSSTHARVEHRVKKSPMNWKDIKNARDELPYLRKITAGKKVLLSR